jgi:hypothetical protein
MPEVERPLLGCKMRNLKEAKRPSNHQLKDLFALVVPLESCRTEHARTRKISRAVTRRPSLVQKTIGSGENYYFESATTCLMNGTAFGVPRPVTLSHPGPVVSDESVPKVNTSQRVDAALWNSALM